jgi:hypothetical protein
LRACACHGAVDDGGSEPPLKRARSSSAGVDASSTGFAAADSADGTPGLDCREDTPGDLAHGGWRAGDDRELRDAALNAELARYMIRTEPLGTDRNHQRYWYMHVSTCPESRLIEEPAVQSTPLFRAGVQDCYM